MYKDPYKTLGVSPDASDDEIKTIYRKLSRKYHPDANIGKPDAKEAEEKFKDINTAYDEIMDMRSKGYNYSSQSTSYGSYTASGAGYRSQSTAYKTNYNQYNGGAYNGYGTYGAYGAYNNQNQYQDMGGFESYDSMYSNYTKGWIKVDLTRLRALPEGNYLESVVNLLNAGNYNEAKMVLGTIKTRSGMYYYLSALTFMKLGEIGTAYYQAKLALTIEPSNPAYMELYIKLQSSNSMYNSSSDFIKEDRRTAIISGAVIFVLCGGLCCGSSRTAGVNLLWLCL